MTEAHVLYLLDANVLIDAQRDYYPLERIPEFWEWLAHQGAEESVKIPEDIFRKLTDASDELANWLRAHESELKLKEELPVDHIGRVISHGYGLDLGEGDLEVIAEDAMLIAYALVSPSERCAVTTERSRPRRRGANRHIPDVCGSLDVSSLHTFGMLRELNFTTDWRTKVQ